MSNGDSTIRFKVALFPILHSESLEPSVILALETKERGLFMLPWAQMIKNAQASKKQKKQAYVRINFVCFTNSTNMNYQLSPEALLRFKISVKCTWLYLHHNFYIATLLAKRVLMRHICISGICHPLPIKPTFFSNFKEVLKKMVCKD